MVSTTVFRTLCCFAALVGIARAETVDLSAEFPVSGSIANLQQTAERAGLEFQVTLRNLAYTGRVTRSVLQHDRADRATLWLGLRDVTLTVERTDIAGRTGSAACGPMKLVLGNRRELWIAFDVARVVQDGQARPALQNVRFQLPPDNWQIGAPAWFRGNGLGMTEERVVEALREGLTKDRHRVEQAVIKAAPAMLAYTARSSQHQQKVIEAVRARLTEEAKPAPSTEQPSLASTAALLSAQSGTP